VAGWAASREGGDPRSCGELLRAAHARGLEAVETTLLQHPLPENGYLAVASAVVRMGEEGVRRLEAHLGARLRDLTRSEAAGWIRRLEGDTESTTAPEGRG
jgi:hypothetical protein